MRLIALRPHANNHQSVKVHCSPGGSIPSEGPSTRLGPCENMTTTRCTNQVSAAPRLKSLLEHAGNARDISHGSASDCDSLIAASEVMVGQSVCLCPAQGLSHITPFTSLRPNLQRSPFSLSPAGSRSAMHARHQTLEKDEIAPESATCTNSLT